MAVKTLNRPSSPEMSQSSTHHRRRKYHVVRFDLKATEEYSRPPFKEGELRSRWYSERDYTKWKDASFEKARNMEKEDKKLNGQKYKDTCHYLLGKLLDACTKAREDSGKCLLKKKDMVKLGALIASSDRCGLERALRTDLMADKLNRRYSVLRKVFVEQRGHNGSGSPFDLMHGPVDKDDIREVSERQSLCSRLLARHLAMAFATALPRPCHAEAVKYGRTIIQLFPKHTTMCKIHCYGNV